MTGTKLSRMTEEQLVAAYVQTAREEEQLLRAAETVERQNRCIKRGAAIKKELKSRPGDARRLLRPYLDDPAWTVRYRAATAMYPIDPKLAITVMQDCSNNAYPLETRDSAWGSLYFLERGVGDWT